MSTTMIDLERVRAQFPSLAREVGGRRAVWTDGPGGSQVPARVIEAVGDYYRHSNSNEGGMFGPSEETGELIEAARLAAGEMLGSQAQSIAFGQNMTTLNFLLAHAVARTLSPGDRVVVTELDHEANISPWVAVAADHGLEVDIARADRAGSLDVEHLEGLLTKRTRVVAFTLASNALGSIPDARRVATAAHEVGALAWADGVHCAPHRRLDRRALGLDVLLCSPYKWFGPRLGIAALSPELAGGLPADRVRPAAEWPVGHRFETGTIAHELLAGMIEAVGYLADLSGSDPDSSRANRLDDSYRWIESHETALSRRFLEGSARIPGLEVHGITDLARVADRTPTFLLTVGSLEPREACRRMGLAGFFAWHGDYYAPAAVRAVGLGEAGGVRVGFLHYTTEEEVDDLLGCLRGLAG